MDPHSSHNLEAMEEQFLKAHDDYAEAIYRHCYFRVFSKAKAEDLTQETFLRTWDYLSDGKKEVENLRAFLYRVANNLIIDASRKKKEASLEATLEETPNMEPATDGRSETERIMLGKEVLAVLGELPEDERHILTLRYVDELEPREIAEMLGISANHVSVKVNRAMKILRERWENKTEE